MQQNIVIRNGKDRLRYTILFEFLLVAILAPASAMVLEKEFLDVGMLAVFLSLKAMLFNLIYNWFFDRFDVRAGRVPTERSVCYRVLHAAGFEIGLLFTSLPIVIWWLGLTIWQALLMDLVITSFVVLYTLVFTWGYDHLFPISQAPSACVASSNYR